MKKAATSLLLCLTCIFIGLLSGFFIGRNFFAGEISLSSLKVTTQAQSLTPSEPTEAISLAQPTDPTDAARSTEPAEPTQPEAACSAALVNINTASVDLLKTLPGIGDVLAQRIIDYRDENGPFESLSDLINVSGIGEKKLEALIDYATVGG